MSDTISAQMPAGLHHLCPRCGASMHRAAGGVCARCLLETALSGPDPGTTPHDSPQLQAEPGTSLGRVGRYELIEETAHGGMGVVYRARDLTLNRVVALKLLLAGQFAGQREVKRFRAEAEAGARLDHPNIVPIYEVGEQDGRPFFSMKFMEGGSLTDWLGSTGAPVDPHRAVLLIIKIARAVHHAHQRAVLHRDLKPGNILLDTRGEPHVSDFGLAKCLDSPDGLTLSGAMLGSPSYMSPEQAAGHVHQLTTASDIYSLGALLYQLFTGRPPFEGATPLATLDKVLHQEPRPPRALQPGLDPDLETICLKCLEKEPSKRYGSAESLAEDLERWLRREPLLARPIGIFGRLRKWTQRHPATAILLVISGLAILAFLVGQTVMSVRLSRAKTNLQAANLNLSQSLHEMRWSQADDAARAGEHSEAIARFSQFLREDPKDTTAAARLLSLVSSCNFPIMLLAPLLHENPVVALDFGQAGNRLATSTVEGRTRIWNLSSGKPEFELPHAEILTYCLLCGEKDLRLLTVSSELKARLWDVGTHRMISEIELGPLDKHVAVRHADRTTDRRWLALNINSNVVGILDADSGTWVDPSLTLPAAIHRFALSTDGHLLAVASRSEVRLCQVGSPQPVFPPVALAAPPQDLRFSPDARWLACLSENKVWLMNTRTGDREPDVRLSAPSIVFLGKTDRLITFRNDPAQPLAVVDSHTGQDCGSPFGQLEFDARSHGDLLFSSTETLSYFPNTLRLRDPATGRFEAEPFIHDGPISVAKFSPDGRVVATASQDRTVRIWSPGMVRAEPLTFRATGKAWEAQWSPAGDRILSAWFMGNDGELRILDARTGAALAPTIKLDTVCYFAQWSHDGHRLATALPNFVVLWDADTGKPLGPPLRHPGDAVAHCAFSPNGAVLATAAGGDRSVRLWDGFSGKPVGAPLVHSSQPLKLSFGSDGHRLATACLDGTIRVWSVPDGRLILGPLHHGGVCWVAAFSPDDRWLVSASSDTTAQLWDGTSGQALLPPFRHESPVLWASFSPDGRAIATSTEAGLIRVWNSTTGQLLFQPARQPGKTWYVTWSPDGRFLATTCTDGSARIWDALTGHLVAEPFSHQAEVRRAEFSPDGQRLLTASFDGTVKIWDLALLRPPLPVPGWLPGLGESLVGKRIGSKDSVESVPGDSFQVARDRTEQWGANDYYGRWAHWLLQERFERPVKPFQPQ